MGAKGERRYERLAIFRNLTAASVAVLLAACGGGSGINSAGSGAPPTGVATPTPTPPVTPPPTPAPSPSAADTREYEAFSRVELGWTLVLCTDSTLRVGLARAFDAGHLRGASDAAAFFAIAIR